MASRSPRRSTISGSSSCRSAGAGWPNATSAEASAGSEPELAADARESLAFDRIVEWSAADVSRTIADGTRTQALGVRTFAHLRALLDGIVTVSEEEIAAGVRLGAEEARLVVEPSGALVIAALRFHADELGLADVRGSIVGVVSGGNVDPERYATYLRAPIPG